MTTASPLPPPLPIAQPPFSAPPRAARSSIKFSAIWSLYLLTLRAHQHGKRWMIMTALMLLPAGLAFLMRHTARDVPPLAIEFIFVFMLIPQAILPLAGLIYASGIIQDELEEQTFTYLLIRPIPKWAIYLAKLLATITTTVVLTILFTALTYAAIYAGSSAGTASAGNILSRCITACAIHSLAVITYCCLFGLMSLLTRRVLVVGILYIAIVEGLFANLAFGIRLLTVIYYLRIIAYRMLPFIVPTPYGPADYAANAWQLDVKHDPNLLEHPTVRTCLIVLFTASFACTFLAMILCSRREFHMKTPEKA
jgi:ABC-2 type transport system permease protein